MSSLSSLSQQENLSLMTSVFLKANRSVLLLFLSLSVTIGRWMTRLEQTCDMLQGIFEAKQKQSCLKQEVKGGIENLKPTLSTIEQSKVVL